jgi:outer membrane protein OmpA-like peptidoglycan-associated protein
MSNGRRLAYAGVLLVAGIASQGCATRGFVRNEVGTLRQRVDQVESSADQAGNLARGSDQKAGQAMQEAQLARDMALGNVRREEVRTATVYFDFDEASLREDGRGELDSVVHDLQSHPNYVALISGYTDATGEDDYNVGLAQRRAGAVHRYLAEQLGKEFVRLVHIGFGEVQPAGDNETREGRQLNRRVEVLIVRPVAPETSSGSPTTS